MNISVRAQETRGSVEPAWRLARERSSGWSLELILHVVGRACQHPDTG